VEFNKGVIKEIDFDNTFQLSQLALPRLKPGKNRVKVFRGPDEGHVQLVRARADAARRCYIVESKNLEPGKVRPAARDGSPACAVYKLTAPAALTALSAGGNINLDPGHVQSIEALYSLDAGKTWTSLWKVADNTNKDNSQFEMDKRVELKNPAGSKEALVKFLMRRRSGTFGVSSVRLYAFYRQPQPAGARLAVDFAWQEKRGGKWGPGKTKSVVVGKFPHEFELECGGEAARVWRITMKPAP